MKKILIVDDEKDIVEIYQQFLEDKGYEVVCCSRWKRSNYIVE